MAILSENVLPSFLSGTSTTSLSSVGSSTLVAALALPTLTSAFMAVAAPWAWPLKQRDRMAFTPLLSKRSVSGVRHQASMFLPS